MDVREFFKGHPSSVKTTEMSEPVTEPVTEPVPVPVMDPVMEPVTVPVTVPVVEKKNAWIYCFVNYMMLVNFDGRWLHPLKNGATDDHPVVRLKDANKQTYDVNCWEIAFAVEFPYNPERDSKFYEKKVQNFFSDQRFSIPENIRSKLKRIKSIDGTRCNGPRKNNTREFFAPYPPNISDISVAIDINKDAFYSICKLYGGTFYEGDSFYYDNDENEDDGDGDSDGDGDGDGDGDCDGESENDEDENVGVCVGAGGGEGIGPKGNRTKDAMRLYFKDGQQIRHAIGNDIWYGTYKYSINKIVREDIQYSALSSFAKQHHVSVGSTSAGGNGWTVCYCEVENGKWIPANDLPKNTIGSSE